MPKAKKEDKDASKHVKNHEAEEDEEASKDSLKINKLVEFASSLLDSFKKLKKDKLWFANPELAKKFDESMDFCFEFCQSMKGKEAASAEKRKRYASAVKTLDECLLSVTMKKAKKDAKEKKQVADYSAKCSICKDLTAIFFCEHCSKKICRRCIAMYIFCYEL